jgi:noggin
MVLLLALVSLISLTRAAPYVAPHPNTPLGLKDGDAPLDFKNHIFGSVHKQRVEQQSNHYWEDDSKYAASLLRPEPEDDFPIVPISVPDGVGGPPTSVDLHARRLRKILGGPIDSRYLSEKEPLDHILRPNGTLVYRFEKGKPKGRIPDEFRKLRFVIPERRSSIRIKSKKTRRKVQEFLWAYSYCPVMFHWRDLGPRIWPRWIREGSCVNVRESCSFPAGMTCHPKGKTDLHMLYWHCKRKNSCKWIKFQYSIVSECGCGC